MSDLKFERIAKDTEYFKLLQDSNQTIGVSHHKTGLGKLKIVDNGTEYGVLISDILSKNLSDWRIDKK